MDDWPSEARVESELFDVLPGTWTISYSYLDYNDMPQEIKDVEVKIEAGVDDKTCKEYRARNMLVLSVPGGRAALLFSGRFDERIFLVQRGT
jgi:hypothetical protein